MLKKLRIKNFKSWEDTGEIEMAPITMFFGGNSSGKSSILQFLLMLKQTANSYDKAQILNFGGKKNDIINLGNFRDVVFEHDLEKAISFGMEQEDGTSINQWICSIKYKDDLIAVDAIEYLKIDYKGEIFRDSSGDKERMFTYMLFHFDDLALEYIGPLRQFPEREYQWKNNEPSTIGKAGEYAIDAILSSKRGDLLEKKIAQALKEMGLVESFRVEEIPTTDLYRILVKKTEKSAEVLLPDIGFGISQILPILVSLFYLPEDSIIILEQPEIHLHPKAQIELADVVIKAVKERGIRVIIESHSEHFLTRIQTRIADGTLAKNDAKLYFCKNEIGKSELEELKIDDSGRIDNWPKDFFGDMLGEVSNRVHAYLDRKRTSKK